MKPFSNVYCPNYNIYKLNIRKIFPPPKAPKNPAKFQLLYRSYLSTFNQRKKNKNLTTSKQQQQQQRCLSHNTSRLTLTSLLTPPGHHASLSQRYRYTSTPEWPSSESHALCRNPVSLQKKRVREPAQDRALIRYKGIPGTWRPGAFIHTAHIERDGSHDTPLPSVWERGAHI